MRRALLLLLPVLLLPIGPGPVAAAGPQPLPTAAEWRADVKDVMSGSAAYLKARKKRAKPKAKLAINLDIDNTMLATQYDPGAPVRPVLAFARTARRLGIKVFVNTARRASLRDATLEELANAGFEVDGICLRRRGTDAADSKPKCRARFRQQGFKLVANVGNNPTDFSGGGYEKAYRLPNYDGQLT